MDKEKATPIVRMRRGRAPWKAEFICLRCGDMVLSPLMWRVTRTGVQWCSACLTLLFWEDLAREIFEEKPQ